MALASNPGGSSNSPCLESVTGTREDLNILKNARKRIARYPRETGIHVTCSVFQITCL